MKHPYPTIITKVLALIDAWKDKPEKVIEIEKVLRGN